MQMSTISGTAFLPSIPPALSRLPVTPDQPQASAPEEQAANIGILQQVITSAGDGGFA
ncbi:MAG: Uncharacterised protein [SAR116 cluster bacterium]|nr:MAG: Uncharacterised protein [SAR116 cluster bacterium]